MLQDKLLLVGSVPLASAEEVMQLASDTLGAHLDCIPDGEVHDRRYWVLRMAFQLFNGHAAFETMHRPDAPLGAEKLIPACREDVWRFRLKPGIDHVAFDMPGWRLGYAKDAQNSYAIFASMKREGRIRPDTRFQVSLPAVNSVVNPSIFGTDERELAITRAAFLDALEAEARQIAAIIPDDELAIQFDCSFEVTDVHGATGLPIEGSIERNVEQFRRLCARGAARLRARRLLRPGEAGARAGRRQFRRSSPCPSNQCVLTRLPRSILQGAACRRGSRRGSCGPPADD